MTYLMYTKSAGTDCVYVDVFIKSWCTYRVLVDGDVELPGSLERDHGLGVRDAGELRTIHREDLIPDLQPRLGRQPSLSHGLDVDPGGPLRPATDTINVKHCSQ